MCGREASYSHNPQRIWMTMRVLWPLLAALLLLCSAAPSAVPDETNALVPGITAQEQAWLKEHPVLRMGVGVAFPPFQYVEREKDEHVFKGMVSDYTRLLGARLGVRLEPVYGITFKQALDMGRTGEIDLFPCISNTPERRQFLAFTEPYLSYPLVIITRDDFPVIGGIHDLQARRVAVVKTLATYSKFLNDYPDVKMNFVFEKTVPDVLTAVSLGRAEACVINLAVASHLINIFGYSNLRVAAPTPWENNNLAMAVPKDRTILTSILQKALNSIPQTERDEISQRWISLRTDRLVDIQAILVWVLPAAALIFVIFLAIAAWNRKLQSEIANRMRAEEELRTSRKHYRDLFDGMLDGFALHEIITDETGEPVDYRFLAVNPSFQHLTGLSPEAVVGRTVLEVIPHIERSWIERYGRVALTGEPARFDDYSAELKRHYEVRAYRPAEGQFAVIFSDVTEKVRAREMLIQSEKMLSLGGLAAGMAHEINNPLGGILQSTQNIRRRFDPELEANRVAADACGIDLGRLTVYLDRRGIVRMLQSISSSGEKAAKIVASMLSFSRDEGTSRRACDLTELVEEALAIASSDFNLVKKHDFRSINIKRDFAPGMPKVTCSKTQVEQVILNLLRNASQALTSMSPRPATPTIALSTSVLNGHAELRITDNGPGMDDNTKNRIFEPFYTTKPPGEGTGLGLSMAYYIITQSHSGELLIESSPDRGSTFIIRLPL